MPCLNRFKKIIIPLLLALGVFFTPSAKVLANTYSEEISTFASTGTVNEPTWYKEYKNTLTNFIETKQYIKSDKRTVITVWDFSPYKDITFNLIFDNSIYIKFSDGSKFALQGASYSYDSNGKFLNNSDKNFTGDSYNGVNSFPLQNDTDYSKTDSLNYRGIKFNGDVSEVFPPPPSLDEEGINGYNFVYPSSGQTINLHASSDSNYYQVPFKVDVKNFSAFSIAKDEELIKDSSKINNYKTVINTITWVKKHSWIGSDNRYFVEGYFYLPVSSLNKEEILNFNTSYPVSVDWVSNPVTVKFTSDGSLPEYKPDTGENGGNIDSDGNVSVGGDDYGQIPQPPKDGSVGDWFSYIGNLLFWIITYPFKLVGNIVSTLVGYVTNMFSILQPVTNQLNSVLSFIPQDILNACWGFLSFTILYSVIKSVFKMIRG